METCGFRLKNMKRIGDYGGYPVDLVTQKEYDTKCQYQENIIFAIKVPDTIRARMHLNGSYVGLLDRQNMRVLSYDDSNAPKEWKKPVPKPETVLTAVEQPRVQSLLFDELDKRYREVIAEFYKVCCK